jgi:hypothetical protein
LICSVMHCMVWTGVCSALLDSGDGRIRLLITSQYSCSLLYLASSVTRLHWV